MSALRWPGARVAGDSPAVDCVVEAVTRWPGASAPEVARRAGCSVASVYRAVDLGRVVAVRFDVERYYLPEALERGGDPMEGVVIGP